MPMPDNVLRYFYEAALLSMHGDDKARGAFKVAADFVRLEGKWSTSDGQTTLPKDIGPILATLPATWGVEGKPRADLVNFFQVPGADLSPFGYAPLYPVRGLAIYGKHFTYNDAQRVPFLVQSPEVRAAGRDFEPKYVAESQRMPLEEAWETIGRVCPGVNREYLQLLIAAKGCAEGGGGIPPIILVDGPSGSAKSGTVHLAAAIAGDTFTEVVFSSDGTRFRQSIMTGCESSGFVVCNEILKDAARERIAPQSALDPILNLTPNSVSHKMYVGPVPLGALPVLIITDVNTPPEIRNDQQLGRRMIHVRLTSRLAWETTLPKTIGEIKRFRVADSRYAAASNALLSYVIDRWFTLEPPSFFAIAKDLGFNLLEHSEDFDDPLVALREFFRIVCSASGIAEGPDKRRWPGNGWKVIKREESTDLAEAWRAVAEATDWSESRRCRERDWQKVLGAAQPITFDLQKASASKVAVRFRCGSRQSPTAVNEECV